MSASGPLVNRCRFWGKTKKMVVLWLGLVCNCTEGISIGSVSFVFTLYIPVSIFFQSCRDLFWLEPALSKDQLSCSRALS